MEGDLGSGAMINQGLIDSSYPEAIVKRIDLLDPNNAMGLVTTSVHNAYVLNITLKSSDEMKLSDLKDRNFAYYQPMGVQPTKAFVPNTTLATPPVLYWNPNVNPSVGVKVNVDNAIYRMVIEGITDDGQLIHQTCYLTGTEQ